MRERARQREREREREREHKKKVPVNHGRLHLLVILFILVSQLKR